MTPAASRDHDRLLSTALAYRKSKPLLVALELDLFTWIHRGLRTPEALSRRLRLDLRATGILLAALHALGFVERKGRAYANVPLARRLLVSTSPGYKGNNLKYQEHLWAAWSELGRVVRTGRPRHGLIDWIHKKTFTDDYIRAMGDVAQGPARDLASKLGLGAVTRTLDVGCGPGVYSAAFVDRNPELEAVLLDLPRTLSVTRRLLAKHPRADRFEFRPADFLKDSFGSGEFDLVLISNVTHCESAENNRRLVRSAYRALRPGGRLVIHDYVSDPGLGSPEFVGMLGVHLLVFTGRGNVYTLNDYAGWLRKEKFRDIAHKRVAVGTYYPSVAVIGRK